MFARHGFRQAAFVIGIATGAILVLAPAGQAGKRASHAADAITPLVADLGHANYFRRKVAIDALKYRDPAVPRLLKAAGRDPQTDWCVKRVLIHWAKVDGDAHTQLFNIARSGRIHSQIAHSALNDPAVRRASRERQKRTAHELFRAAGQVIRHGHNQPFIRVAQRAASVRSMLPTIYVRLFVSDVEVAINEPCPLDSKLMAGQLLGFAYSALEKRKLGRARALAHLTQCLDVTYSVFELSPSYVLFQVDQLIDSWTENHLQEPAIGGVGMMALRLHRARENYRRELSERWKRRFLWPVRMGASFGLIPIYPSSRDIRARELIFHSEDLRHVPEIWQRAWAKEMPDIAKPFRVHGGVI